MRTVQEGLGQTFANVMDYDGYYARTSKAYDYEKIKNCMSDSFFDPSRRVFSRNLLLD